MGKDTIIIKPFATETQRNLSATSRYMQDLRHDGAKVPYDEFGRLSGAINCAFDERDMQLKQISNLVELHGNALSIQAAEHSVLSYPTGIRPTRAQIERDLKINLKKLGMDDHLLIWDAHSNTNNFHVHFLLCRVVPTPDKHGRYPLADNGIVKETRRDKKRNRIRTHTNEVACHQAAIAEINELYGIQNGNLTHDKNGAPMPRFKKKDSMSDKTRAGERKTGKASKERQLAAIIKEIFDQAAKESIVLQKPFWAIADKLFASKALQMTINLENGRAVGGFITGPSNRKCSFGKAGKEYTTPALVKRFGEPHSSDSAGFATDLKPFQYQNLHTKEEIKKHLLKIIPDCQTWETLVADTQHLGSIKRSGGGLIFSYNDNRGLIKFSEISNKYSLSKLEKVLGPCPLRKTVATADSRREQLRIAAETILFKHVSESYGLHKVQYDFGKANIQFVQKNFVNNNGKRIDFWAIQKDGMSIPLSQIARTSDDKPMYSMRQLEFLDKKDQRYQAHLGGQAWLAWAENHANSGQFFRSIQEHHHKKEQKINNLTLFAAVAKFVKNMRGKNVHTISPKND